MIFFVVRGRRQGHCGLILQIRRPFVIVVITVQGVTPQALECGTTIAFVRTSVQLVQKTCLLFDLLQSAVVPSGVFAVVLVVTVGASGHFLELVPGQQQVTGRSHDAVLDTVKAGSVPVLSGKEQLLDFPFVRFGNGVHRQAGLPTVGTIVILQKPFCRKQGNSGAERLCIW